MNLPCKIHCFLSSSGVDVVSNKSVHQEQASQSSVCRISTDILNLLSKKLFLGQPKQPFPPFQCLQLSMQLYNIFHFFRCYR